LVVHACYNGHLNTLVINVSLHVNLTVLRQDYRVGLSSTFVTCIP